MKILAIRGSNLASLKGPFEVDFEAPPLRDLGLFAIAGPVGAGKSTLLDAMCLALFNRTPRLSGHGGAPVIKDKDAIRSNDPRSLVRRGVAGAFAEVDMRGVDGRVYRARWQVRRARGQAFGKLQAPELSLVDVATGGRIGDGTMDTLAHIEGKLGLSFDELCRSMLLAQGSFSSFLRAKPEERAALLEKITGTELYSTLSLRAFGRARVEEAGLAALEDQLRALAPADGERRRSLEESAVRAAELGRERAAILETAEARERHAAHMTALEAGVREAERARDEAMESRAASAATASVARLAPLWPLRGAWRTLVAARGASAAALEAAAGAREQQHAASGLLASLGERSQRAAAALLERRGALANAEPLLERAMLLDGQIARATMSSLVDEHARAAAECAGLAAARAQADAACAVANAALQRAQAFLGAEPALASLLGMWPTVQALLEQLVRIDTNLEGARALAHAVQSRRDDAAEVAERMTRTLEDAAAIDREAKRAVRAAFGAAWDEVCAGKADARATAARDTDAGETNAAENAAEVDAAEIDAAEIDGGETAAPEDAAPVLARMIALVDARARADERSEKLRGSLAERRRWEARVIDDERLAEEAHRDAAEELARANALAARAALVDGEPCGVCGSLDHPARATPGDAHGPPASTPGARPVGPAAPPPGSAADDVVERARDRAVRARAAAEARAAAQARTSEAACALDEHEAATRLTAERAGTAAIASCDEITVARAKTALEAWRCARAARWAARGSSDAATHTLQLESAALALHSDALVRLHDERGERAASLSELLGDAELAALEQPRAALPALRARVEALRAHALAAGGARARVAEAESVRHELDLRAAGVGAHAEQLRVRADAARDEQAVLLRDRAALFDGAATALVRVRLVEAVEESRAADTEATLALAQAHIRSHEADRRRREREEDALRTSDALAAHELSFAELARGANVASDDVAACAILDDNALEDARAALRALDDALARSEAVGSERRAALALHASTAARFAAGAQVDVSEARALLAEALSSQGVCTAALLHDDDLRARAAALLPAVEAQRIRARTWTALADVIGSADGARFRVFAQSLTLDALLVRANEQLAQLAPRYRLERVPSEDKRPRFDLELVVVDGESGDEPRGVTSLSGGETFLVSLALALGLSSLSASRTPVESLFIDEGFSSLDAETLEAALAALDALRATGRQIGVISHVPALVERIGAQVRVVPLGGGRSRVDVRAS